MPRPPSPPLPPLPFRLAPPMPWAGDDSAGPPLGSDLTLPDAGPGISAAGADGDDDPRHPEGAVARLARSLDVRSVLDRSRWLRLRDEAARWAAKPV